MSCIHVLDSPIHVMGQDGAEENNHCIPPAHTHDNDEVSEED